MNKYRLITLLLSLWLGCGAALGDETAAPGHGEAAVVELLSVLGAVNRLQGAFRQRLYAEDGQLLETSSGRFRLLRPGYFSWEIETPDSQLIVATPQYIWHYDRDLETATRRPVAASSQMTPLQVLGGDQTALRQNFTVVRDPSGDFVLTPVADDPGFLRLALHVEEDRILGMDIFDNLNQKVIISFSALDASSALSAADFIFQPPEGVDLFYYDP